MAARGEGEGEKVLTRPRRVIEPERLTMTEEMYLAGKSRARITSALCAKYKITARQARRYIAVVEKRLAELPKPSPEATAERVEAILLEALDLARNSVQRLVVSQRKGEPSRVEEYPQANVGVMVTVATRLAELRGVTVADPSQKGRPGRPVMELPAFLTTPRIDPDEVPAGGAGEERA